MLLDDRKFRAKAVISILKTTKILSSDKDYLFKIVEIDTGTQFHIAVSFQISNSEAITLKCSSRPYKKDETEDNDEENNKVRNKEKEIAV